uniref:Uncharacterized protein n=1 Tax=Solibacter usitatus (strain Ellin6076) TaxID=234267 RepID=Q020J3_SOLUE
MPVMSSVDALPREDRDDVRGHLEQVLAGAHFRHSRRCSAMLRYVVEQSLRYPGLPIKERTIGHAVFDRDLAYDTNQDAVVRNAAAEVRKRLAQHYQENGAGPGGLRIELPSGAYVPEFRTPSPVLPPKSAPPPARTRHRPWLFLPVAFVAALAGWLAGVRNSSRPPLTELDQFWAPILAAHAPVQICVGQSRMGFYPERLPETPADPAATIPMSRLIPLRDRFLWIGDSFAMAQISGFLTAREKLYRLRGSQTTPFAELQGNPVVLIGAFNNDWTLRLTEDLRFSLINDGPATRGVRDRGRGTGLAWSVSRTPQGWIADEDYALVTRRADPSTGQTVISAGGITTYGTQAAGVFLTTPAQFREALRSAPRDWPRKNIQIVLQVKVAESTPGPPRVLAAYFW